MQKPLIIGIIGAGNMAQFLIDRLHGSHHLHIWNREYTNSERLAAEYKTIKIHANLESLLNECDIISVAVNDNSVHDVLTQCRGYDDKIFMHHSGSLPTQAHQDIKESGVIWPNYSIISSHVKQYPVDIPIVYNGTNEKVIKVVEIIAKTISQQVMYLNDEQRQVAHSIAVMTNNFMHHLFVKCEALATAHNIPFHIFTPIIQQTVQQLENVNNNLAELQSGPAIRKDSKTINRHLDIIKEDTDLSNIYKAITQSIKNFYDNEQTNTRTRNKK